MKVTGPKKTDLQLDRNYSAEERDRSDMYTPIQELSDMPIEVGKAECICSSGRD